MEKNPNSQLKIKSSTEKGMKVALVSLTGDLTLNEVAAIKNLLMQNLDKHQVFKVSLDDVESIDLGMIQLLYSFKWAAERKSKKVHFEFKLPEEQKVLLEHSGFIELVNNK